MLVRGTMTFPCSSLPTTNPLEIFAPCFMVMLEPNEVAEDLLAA